MSATTGQSQEMYGVVQASKIIGESVVNKQGEDLGKIHELVIDAREGRVAGPCHLARLLQAEDLSARTAPRKSLRLPRCGKGRASFPAGGRRTCLS